MDKEFIYNAGNIRDVGFNPWVRKIPMSPRRTWQPTPVFLPWTEEPSGL